MPKKEKNQPVLMLSAWSRYSQITSRVVVCILGSIALLGIPAYFLDQHFQTWPIISGVALIFSLPLSQFMVIRSMQTYLKNNPLD